MMALAGSWALLVLVGWLLLQLPSQIPKSGPMLGPGGISVL